MLRGINQTQLFYDVEDRQAFRKRLEHLTNEDSFSLYAYSLMGNHVHLLVHEKDEGISIGIKRLALSYSHWFNRKYDRSGYLFQGRFSSEPINDDTYLLVVFRYIHHNPVLIGERIDFWTSYKDYMTSSDLIDTTFILGMFSKDKIQARRLLKEFLADSSSGDPGIIEADKPKGLPDNQAIDAIKRLVGVGAFGSLAQLDKEQRDIALASLKSQGFSIRQISRLTGINRGIVQRARAE